jgi:hypothetical protein
MDDAGSNDFRKGQDDNSLNVWMLISIPGAFKAH